MSVDTPTTHQIAEGSSFVPILLAGGWSDRFWRVQAGSLILLAATSFVPPFFHIQEYLFFTMCTLSFGLVLWRMRTSPLVRTPLDLPLFCFLGWVLCTVPFATDPTYSFSEWRKVIAHILVLYWALLVFRWYGPAKLTYQVLTSVVVGSTLVSAYAITDFLMRGGTWQDRVIRAAAPGSDYNWLSTYMVLAIPVVVSVFLTQRSRIMRAWNGFTMILAIGAQAASYTRAGWLGHIAQIFALGLFTNRRRHLLIGLAGVMMLLVGLLVLSQSGYQKSTIDRWTLASRMSVWTYGLHDITEHPLVGIGYGNDTFIKRHPEYSVKIQERYQEQERVLPAMHSTFLMITLGSGIPACVFFTWMFFRIISMLLVNSENCLAGQPTVLVLGIGIGVIGFGVRNIFDYMFMGSLSHLFWILVATGVALRHKQLVRHGS